MSNEELLELFLTKEIDKTMICYLHTVEEYNEDLSEEDQLTLEEYTELKKILMKRGY